MCGEIGRIPPHIFVVLCGILISKVSQTFKGLQITIVFMVSSEIIVSLCPGRLTHLLKFLKFYIYWSKSLYVEILCTELTHHFKQMCNLWYLDIYCAHNQLDFSSINEQLRKLGDFLPDFCISSGCCSKVPPKITKIVSLILERCNYIY